MIACTHNAYTTLVAFTLTPINTTVCSGSTVQFVCSTTDVTSVSYSLNSKPIPPLPPNVYISAPTVIGGAVVVNMSISNASANAVITYYAYLVNGTVLTRAAYLTVQDSWTCITKQCDIECHTYKWCFRSSICTHWSHYYYIQWYCHSTGLGTTPWCPVPIPPLLCCGDQEWKWSTSV